MCRVDFILYMFVSIACWLRRHTALLNRPFHSSMIYEGVEKECYHRTILTLQIIFFYFILNLRNSRCSFSWMLFKFFWFLLPPFHNSYHGFSSTRIRERREYFLRIQNSLNLCLLLIILLVHWRLEQRRARTTLCQASRCWLCNCSSHSAVKSRCFLSSSDAFLMLRRWLSR
jgi:hypothetical protein